VQPEDHPNSFRLPVGKFIQCDIETDHAPEAPQLIVWIEGAGRRPQPQNKRKCWINRRRRMRLPIIVEIDLQENVTWYLI
jgi:hypothetical protein